MQLRTKYFYMPRILRIINRLNLGGPTFNVAYLTKHLHPQFETLLVSGMIDNGEESSEFILDDLGVKPRYINSMYRDINPLKDLPAYRQLKQIIREYRPDIVHTHAAKAGTLGRLAAYDCGVPVILHTFHGHVFHSYFGALKTRMFLEIERALAKISSRIVAISPQQKHELGNIYNICSPEKIQVVPLGFDLNKFQDNQVNKRIDFRARYHIADNEVAIGIVGRLVPIKNHGLFLQALQQVIAQYGSKVRAFVIGDGEERNNIEQLAQQLNIATATHEQAVAGYRAALTFTSWIKEVDEAYAGLDVVALSSLNEGTPVSLIEAQAAGKAIVSTQVGGVADVVSSGKTALLVPSNDTNAFANALAKLVGNEGLRRKLSKNAPAHVEERYSYRRLTNDMAHLYDQLLHEKVPHYTPAYDLQTSNQIPVFQTMPQVAGFRPMVSRK